MNVTNNIIKYFYKEEKFNIILAILFSLAINFFKVNIISLITANIIKSIEHNNIKYAYKYYNYFIIASIIFIVLFYFSKYFQNKFLSKLKNWVRLYLIKETLNKNNENLQNTNFSVLIHPFTRISAGFEYLLYIILNSAIPNLTLIIIITFFFLYKNIKVGLIFLFGNIILLSYLYYSYHKTLNNYINVEKRTVYNEDNATQIFNNINKILIRGMKDNEIIKYKKNIDHLHELTYEYNSLLNNINLIFNIIVYGILFIIISYLIYLYSKKNITSIIVITFITILLLYRDLILTSLQDFPRFTEFIVRNNETMKLFDQDLNKLIYKSSQPSISNITNNNLETSSIFDYSKIKFNNIEFKDIHFKYNSDSPKIFDNFNLKININNRVIGLTGLSGNGKSTITKLLLKVYKYHGSILIDDVNIDNIDTTYLRKNIIYVDQSSNLFDRKIIENIHYRVDNDNDNNNKFFNKLLDKAMKYPKIKQLYEDIDFSNNAGFNGNFLSGGQRQVINIINGLTSPSVITILDEPTNALDPELKKEIIKLIKDFKRYNKCIIIITHDKDLYELFDEKIEI